jgi:hypothetical protein
MEIAENVCKKCGATLVSCKSQVHVLGMELHGKTCGELYCPNGHGFLNKNHTCPMHDEYCPAMAFEEDEKDT